MQGAGDMGALPNMLAGHMEVADEAARQGLLDRLYARGLRLLSVVRIEPELG